jgi:esterase/lipase superfamily enzyme
MFLVSTRKRNSDGTFGHERIAKGAYDVYEITKPSKGKEAKEKSLADIPVDDDALVLVHGFNNDFDRVSAAYIEFEKKIAKAGFEGNVVGFTWPSYGVWSQYLGDREQAEYAAFGFLNFLLDFRRLLGANKLHVNAHSMGAHLTIKGLAAYSALTAIPAMGPGGIILDEITFFAPDVDGDILEKGEDGNIAAGEARRLTTYFSRNDKVLAVSELFNGGPRLGLDGTEHPARVPASAYQVDCTTLVFEHSGYRDEPAVMGDAAAVLAGEDADEIAGRREEDDKNTFAIGPEEEDEEPVA